MGRFICYRDLVLVVVLVGLTSVSAASAVPASPWSFVGVSEIIKPAAGLPVPAKFAFRNAANGAWTTRAATIARATVGNVVRRRAFSPWGIAITAGLTAAGYLLDEDTGGIQLQNSPGGKGECGGFLGLSNVTYTACVEAALNTRPGKYYVCDEFQRSDGWWGFRLCWPVPDGHNSPGTGWWYPYDSSVPYNPSGVADASDEDLATWALDNLPDTEIVKLFYDPQTGQPLPLPEAEPLTDQLNQQWRQENQLPEPRTLSVPDNASTDPSQNPRTDNSDWPDACAWMPTICAAAQRLSDWIDWTRDEPDFPKPENPPIKQVGGNLETYNSGLGGGSCPSPPTFVLNGRTFEIPTKPFCDAMTYFRPILLMFASIVAVLIVMGGRDSG